MTAFTPLFPSTPRVEDIRALQEVMPACVEAAVREVGVDVFQQFFDGYKDSADLWKQAA